MVQIWTFRAFGHACTGCCHCKLRDLILNRVYTQTLIPHAGSDPDLIFPERWIKSRDLIPIEPAFTLVFDPALIARAGSNVNAV